MGEQGGQENHPTFSNSCHHTYPWETLGKSQGGHRWAAMSNSIRVWAGDGGKGQGSRETGPSHPQVSEGPDSPDGKTWVCTLCREERSEALRGKRPPAQASLSLAKRSHTGRVQTAPHNPLLRPPSWSGAVMPSRGQQTPASWTLCSCFPGLTKEPVLLGGGL